MPVSVTGYRCLKVVYCSLQLLGACPSLGQPQTLQPHALVAPQGCCWAGSDLAMGEHWQIKLPQFTSPHHLIAVQICAGLRTPSHLLELCQSFKLFIFNTQKDRAGFTLLPKTAASEANTTFLLPYYPMGGVCEVVPLSRRRFKIPSVGRRAQRGIWFCQLTAMGRIRKAWLLVPVPRNVFTNRKGKGIAQKVERDQEATSRTALCAMPVHQTVQSSNVRCSVKFSHWFRWKKLQHSEIEPGEWDASPSQKHTHKHKATILWDKFIQWWTDIFKAMASGVYRALFKLLHKGQPSVENKWKHRPWKLINGDSWADC